MKISTRILFVLGIVLYSISFHWVYIYFLVKTREYYGFKLFEVSDDIIFFTYAISIIPSFIFPLKLDRPSKYLYFLIYIFILIPTFFTLMYSWKHSISELVWLNLTTLAGFILTGMFYKIKLVSLKLFTLNKKAYWSIIYILLALMIIPVLIYFRSTLNFVVDINSADLYEQRFKAGDLMGTGGFIGYGLSLPAGCVLPILMSRGILSKKYYLFVIGVICYLLLYAVGANKSYLFGPLYIVALYWMLKGRGNFFIKMTYLLGIAMFLIAYYQVYGSLTMRVLLYAPASILIMRVIAVGALSMVMYYDFFKEGYPLTYYSHITGFNKIIDYPYDRGLGLMVGKYHSGLERYNANANYIITDGLSSSWLPGILIVSLFLGLIFWFLDSSTKNQSTIYGVMCLSYIGVNITNWSIFTTLLSGGLMLLMLLFTIMPKNAVQNKII